MLLSKYKPVVALGIMVQREGRVLMAKRKGALGFDTWGFPGGKLEGGESLEAGIMRELSEECGEGLKVKNLRFMLLANILEIKPKHFVNICYTADWVAGEAINGEPEKHGEWEWFAMDKLPEPIFAPSRIMLEACKSGKYYRDE